MFLKHYRYVSQLNTQPKTTRECDKDKKKKKKIWWLNNIWIIATFKCFFPIFLPATLGTEKERGRKVGTILRFMLFFSAFYLFVLFCSPSSTHLEWCEQPE